MKDVPKGETVPQTIANLQTIMAADAVLMEALGRENRQLQHTINNLTSQLAAARRRTV